MTDPFARIESLYHAARMLPPRERSAFLAEACGGDEDLRREVSSLLAEHAATGGFLSDVISPAPALVVGQRLGGYQIAASIGAGGMGEVYRARDSKLGRDVAINVLPLMFAADPDRLARFQREARLLAALSHPNIAHVHGFEDSDGVHAIVMELVDGETLADRIARGPIPLADALPIARRITEALEAAHDRGIVHRDLKPSNVALTAAGVVKLLDFGLAKPAAAIAPQASGSPTMTLSAPHDGLLVGTAAYMSPEQARGQSVDARTDVWAFGCVLFEMLTGRQAFPGATTSDHVAAILEREPDWSAVPSAAPPGVRRVLRRCLEKDPARRLRDIADARLDLDDVGHDLNEIATSGGKDNGRAPRRTTSQREWIAWAAAALAAAVAIAVVSIAIWRPRRVPTPPLMRLSIPLPDGIDRPLYMALSSDGQQLAYVGHPRQGTASYIWISSLEKSEAKMLPGTAEALYPFWSPDGRALGFFAEGKLRTIDVVTGVIRELCAAPDGAGGSWTGHTIVFAPQRDGTPLSRVSDDGLQRSPVTVTVLQPSEARHVLPAFLPDGNHFVFTASEKDGATKFAVGSLGDAGTTDLYHGPSSGNRRLTGQDLTQSWVAGGMLVFWRAGSLQAQALDEKAWGLSGDPVVVAPNVADEDGVHRAFAVSNSIVVYRSGVLPPVQRLTWLPRSGKKGTPFGEPGMFSQVQLTRDDTRAIVTWYDGSKRTVSVIDLARPNELRPLTEGGRPVLSRDGLRVLFTKPGEHQNDVHSVLVDGGGDDRVEADMPSGSNKAALGWSVTGSLLYNAPNKDRRLDLWERPTSGDARVLLPADNPDTSFEEAAVTTAGDLVASIVGGKTARSLYVQPIRRGGTRVQVAIGSQIWEPRWRADGRELYYIDKAIHRLMAVEIKSTDPVKVGTPHALLEFDHWQYAPSRDGQRFLAAVSPASPTAPNVIDVVLNWSRVVEK